MATPDNVDYFSVDDALHTPAWFFVMNCKKHAIVGEFHLATLSDGSDVTALLYKDANGDYCSFGVGFRGNPLDLDAGETVEISLTSSGSSSHAESAVAAADLDYDASFQITDVSIFTVTPDGEPSEVVVEAEDIGPVSFEDFLNTIALSDDEQASAQAFVGLLDGDTASTGSDGDDYIENGAGNDTVDAGAGDDTAYKWKPGNLTYDGGAGSDWLIFEPADGDIPTPPNGAVVDLTVGTGTNPFGGTLTLTSVENVVGVFNKSNNLRGNASDNYLGGGIAADTLRGEGGNDTILVKYHTTLDPRATLADGGTGSDTLIAQLSDASAAPFTGSGSDLIVTNTLDLLDPSQNTGTFHGGTFVNFETISASGEYYQRFDFRGSNSAESVRSGVGPDILCGRGGGDVLDSSDGDDIIRGGNGADTCSGGAGDDIIFGGIGRDSTSGGIGDDLLFVIVGENTLVFADGAGADTMVGYKPGIDEFDLTAVAGLDSFDDLTLTDSGDDVLVDYGTGSFLLTNTNLSSVEEGDFSV